VSDAATSGVLISAQAAVMQDPEGGKPAMAKVLVSVRVYPEGMDVDLCRLREEIRALLPKDMSIYKFKEEPLAFGLNTLILHILLPEDRGGDMDRIEELIRRIKGVSEFETLMARRV